MKVWAAKSLTKLERRLVIWTFLCKLKAKKTNAFFSLIQEFSWNSRKNLKNLQYPANLLASSFRKNAQITACFSDNFVRACSKMLRCKIPHIIMLLVDVTRTTWHRNTKETFKIIMVDCFQHIVTTPRGKNVEKFIVRKHKI